MVFPYYQLRCFAFVPLTMALASCGDGPVETKPKMSDLVGTWKCTELPASFLGEVGKEQADVGSLITLREDGTVSVIDFPERDPARLLNYTDTWHVVDPSMTPTGKWTVEVNGSITNFLQCRTDGKSLKLRYWIDPTKEWKADYVRLRVTEHAPKPVGK